MRAKAELELAQYMLKSDDLMLHPEFQQRLRSLPQSYVYGEYRQIYRDYGTHYITEAALGGDFEHTIILNKEKLEKTGNKCYRLLNWSRGGLSQIKFGLIAQPLNLLHVA